MRTKLSVLIASAALLAAAVPVLAHHSFAAEFDAKKPVKLQGTVTNSATNAAIGGASITVGASSTTTDGNGQYTIGSLAPGTYWGTLFLPLSAKVSTRARPGGRISELDLVRAFVRTGGGRTADTLRRLGVRIEELDPDIVPGTSPLA